MHHTVLEVIFPFLTPSLPAAATLYLLMFSLPKPTPGVLSTGGSSGGALEWDILVAMTISCRNTKRMLATELRSFLQRVQSAYLAVNPSIIFKFNDLLMAAGLVYRLFFHYSNWQQ